MRPLSLDAVSCGQPLFLCLGSSATELPIQHPNIIIMYLGECNGCFPLQNVNCMHAESAEQHVPLRLINQTLSPKRKAGPARLVWMVVSGTCE